MVLASGQSRLRLLENEMGMKGFEVCMAESGDLLFCGKATAVATCHWHIAKSRLSSNVTQKKMAGTAGLEPANGGVKVLCLTAWLRPNVKRAFALLRTMHSIRSALSRVVRNGVSNGIRTHGLQSHNLTL